MPAAKQETSKASSALGRLHLKDCSSTYKGKKYPKYAIAESYQKNGKSQKRILKYLPALSLQQVASYRNMLQAFNDGVDSFCNMIDVVFESKKDYLNVAVLLEVWNRLNLSSPFKSPRGNKEVSTEQMAIILTFSKLLKPSSGIKTIRWFKGTFLPELLKIKTESYNVIRIFRELGEIFKRKQSLEKFLFTKAKELEVDHSGLYFVDGTTTFFEGRKCSIARPGKDKSHGYKTHTLLILMMTDRNGYPCAWDLLPGSASESVAFRNLVARVATQSSISEVIFCFDRGFACEENFKTVNGISCKFISGLDKDQIQGIFDVAGFSNSTRIKLVEKSDETEKFKQEKTRKVNVSLRLMPVDGFYTSDGMRFFRELGKIDKYRYVVGFNSEIYKAQCKSREEAISSVLITIGLLNKDQTSSKRDRDGDTLSKKIDDLLEKKKLTSILEYSIRPIAIKYNNKPIQAFSITARVNLEEQFKASHLDGLFVYITDHFAQNEDKSYRLTAHEIISNYRIKNNIELDFFGMKQILDVRPIFARLEKHVSSLISITVLGQFINNYLASLLKKQKIDKSLLEFYFNLNSNSSVAFLQAPGQLFTKLIKTESDLIETLQALSLDDVFTNRPYIGPLQ